MSDQNEKQIVVNQLDGIELQKLLMDHRQAELANERHFEL